MAHMARRGDGVWGRGLQAQGGGQKGGFIGQAGGAGQFMALRPHRAKDGSVPGHQLDEGVAGLRRLCGVGAHGGPPLGPDSRPPPCCMRHR